VFSHFFDTLGAKNTVNTDVFCASEAQNHSIYDVFAFGSKNHGIYSVFGPRLAKTLVVFSMSQEELFPCQMWGSSCNSVATLAQGQLQQFRNLGQGAQVA
jgi:hypothetical protein